MKTLSFSAFLMIFALPGLAHVHGTAVPAAPGAPVTVALSFSHGCDGEPTTGLQVQIPDSLGEVVAEEKPGWQVTREGSVIRWSGGEIPPDAEATFRLTAVPAPGVTGEIRLPVIQSCPTREQRWTGTRASDEFPAPVITVTP